MYNEWQQEPLEANVPCFFGHRGRVCIVQAWSNFMVQAASASQGHLFFFFLIFYFISNIFYKGCKLSNKMLFVGWFCVKVHPPHRYPAKFGRVLLYSPFLLGKNFFFFCARQTCEQQTNTLSQTKLLCHNNTNRQRCVLINFWINPAFCWFFFMLVLIIV